MERSWRMGVFSGERRFSSEGHLPPLFACICVVTACCTDCCCCCCGGSANSCILVLLVEVVEGDVGTIDAIAIWTLIDGLLACFSVRADIGSVRSYFGCIWYLYTTVVSCLFVLKTFAIQWGRLYLKLFAVG